MATPISRRTILAAGAGAAAGLSLPGVAAYAGGHPATRVGFTLDAEVLDGGEQVTSVTLNTARLGPIDPASLTTGTFSVHAKATSPIPLAPGDLIFSEYDLDRPVTAARLDHRGNIVLDLSYAEGQLGGGTLGYIVSKGRNVRLDLVYTITQNAPLALRNGRPVTISSFVQGRLSNPEVDAFSYHVSGSGMKYRLYSPDRRASGRGKRPLIVWLHGGGEGASLPDNYYDNETTLRANRGALGFATAAGTTDLLRRLRRGPAEHVLLARGRPPLRPAHPRDHPRPRAPAPHRPRPDLRRRLQQRRLHELEDDHGLPRPVRRVRTDLRRRRVPSAGRPAADHRRRAGADQHPDLARRLPGRHDRAAGAQHRPRARPHPRLH